MRSALAWDGFDVSEAVVFGLGAGLGFFYRHEPGESPSRRFNGRAPDLEGSFYRRVGVPIRWMGRWRPDLIRRALAAGRPVLAQTDIHPIPYYDDVHFVGHGLAVVGLTTEGEIEAADIAADGLSTMPLEAFRAAVAHAHPPLLEPYRYGVAPKPRSIEVGGLAPAAIRQVATYLLAPPGPDEGLPAMRRLAAELPSWAELEDGRWAARFGYQAIEKRGTGGGNFRALYAAFLREVGAHGVEAPGASELEQAASAWTDAGEELKKGAFADDGATLVRHLRAAAGHVARAADLEEAVQRGLAERFGADVST